MRLKFLKPKFFKQKKTAVPFRAPYFRRCRARSRHRRGSFRRHRRRRRCPRRWGSRRTERCWLPTSGCSNPSSSKVIEKLLMMLLAWVQISILFRVWYIVVIVLSIPPSPVVVVYHAVIVSGRASQRVAPNTSGGNSNIVSTSRLITVESGVNVVI